jgi:hypothetical protein
MSIVKTGLTFAVIGFVFWIVWALVNGGSGNFLWASAEEWATLLEHIWTSTLIVAPAGAFALGIYNVARGLGFMSGNSVVE